MKTVEITPREKSPLYGSLIKREAEIRMNGRGTFARKGTKRAGATTWAHKKFKGTVRLKRGDAELVSARIRSARLAEEFDLLKAFLGFVDRHCRDQVATIIIHYQ